MSDLPVALPSRLEAIFVAAFDRAGKLVAALDALGPIADVAEIAEVDRVLRPGGRHLAVHDYGRDDMSHLHGDRPEYGAWSHRLGPFLTGGFRVRVVHCFLEFDTQDAATQFLSDAFAEAGAALAATLKRPRLSYNVAVYHRSRP